METTNTLPLSMADLDKDETPAELQAREAAEKAAKDTAAQEAANKTEADKKAAAETEAQEKAAAEAKAKEVANDKTEEVAEDEPDPAKFWNDVNKLHGFDNFKVEYGKDAEGNDIDPLSEQGAYIREKSLIEYTRNDVEETIKKADPRGYAYLLHREQGGDDESFFAKPSVTLPDYTEFQNNVDLQKKLVVNDLRNKGLAENQINMLVEQMIKDKALSKEADDVYKATKTSEDKALADAEKAVAIRTQREQAVTTDMLNTISDIVKNNKTKSLQIPDTKKELFTEYLKQHLLFDGEKFFMVKPAEKQSLEQLIEYEYFAFVQGKLDELVVRKAQTQNVAKYRLGGNSKGKVVTSTGGNEGKNNSDYITVGEI